MVRVEEWIERVVFFLISGFFLVMISLADRFGKKKKIVPASPGLRPQENAGYVEPKRTQELRAAYVARRATREEILAAEDKNRAMALIRDAGGC